MSMKFFNTEGLGQQGHMRVRSHKVKSFLVGPARAAATPSPDAVRSLPKDQQGLPFALVVDPIPFPRPFFRVFPAALPEMIQGLPQFGLT
jgi:hypothetical protein